MKAPNYIEDLLRENKSPMRKEFRHQLRAQLYQKAQQRYQRSSSFMIIFSSLLQNMKRYSFAYLTGLVMIVFGLTTFIKTPLSAEEVLANALENYELEEGIYHNKVHFYEYQEGEMVTSEIRNTYSDKMGNFLEINQDSKQSEPSVQLTQKNSLGDTKMFATEDHAKSTIPITQEQQNWLDIFEGEKVFCVEKMENEHHYGFVNLTLASEDYSVYTLSGESEAKEDFASISQIDKILDFSKPQSPLNYMLELMDSGEAEYKFVSQEGQNYYLFKIPTQGYLYWFYLDAKNFQLSHYEVHEPSGPENSFLKFEILENEYLPESQADSIFDPTRFKNIKEGYPMLDAGTLPFKIKGSGCFDSKGIKMTDDFLSQLPADLILEREKMIESVRSGIEQDEELLVSQFDPNQNKILEDGVLTQGYHAGHYAWDLAKEGESVNIHVPFDGKVEEVKTGEWNGGYGDAVKISHQLNGKKIETFYAHVAEINVKVGQEVKAGEIIGKTGDSGRANGKHVHFEVRIEGKKVDPSVLWQD